MFHASVAIAHLTWIGPEAYLLNSLNPKPLNPQPIVIDLHQLVLMTVISKNLRPPQTSEHLAAAFAFDACVSAEDLSSAFSRSLV